MAHPAIERMRYPAPDEAITDEFRTYAFYALQEEESIEGLDVILSNEQMFNEMLEYAKTYKLWALDWPSIIDTYMEMFTTRHILPEGKKPCELNGLIKSVSALIAD